MKKILLISSIFLSVLTYVTSTGLNYTDLPQGSYDEVTGDTNIASLSQLFVMTKGFVDIVFQPFCAIEEFIYDLIVDEGNFIEQLLQQWQQLATFEVGFLACFFAGCIFIVFVPLVGLIMCCCRTCCDNCGGEMVQTEKRVLSKWRHCFCGTLLILTIFIAVPCVFVFLTNQWTTEVVASIPTKTSNAFTDIVTYIDTLPNQIDHIVGEYGRLDESLRDNVVDVGTILGVPIRDAFLQLSNSTLEQLNTLSDDLDTALSSLTEVQNATNALSNSTVELNDALASEKTSLDTDLNDASCNSSVICIAVQASTVALTSGGDFSSLADVQAEIDNLNNIASSYNIDGEIAKILQEINNIPQLVDNSTSDAVNRLLTTLNEVNSTLIGQLSNLPLDSVINIKDSIIDFNSTIFNISTTYADQYDQYRYIAGVVLGSVLAVICGFYILGMLLGTCGFDETMNPSTRSSTSNCGGLFMMASVGFSFIFSWLLMILVTLSFTIGGHGERYLCQNFESPYEGLKFADKVLLGTGTDLSQNIFGDSNVNITINGVLKACENNESAYEALKLEYLFNITGIVTNTTSVLTGFQDNLMDVTVDLSSIKVYPPELQNALIDMKTSGLTSINFASYITQINGVISSDALTSYALYLNESADNISSSSPLPGLVNVTNRMRSHSYSIILLRDQYLVPVVDDLDKLNRSVLILEEITSGFNQTIDNTDNELRNLNNTIQTEGSDYVLNETINYSNLLIGDITGFTDWLLIQITENFGACLPVFLVYSQVISLLCDYLMDILNALWFSLGWSVFFLIPAAIVGMKLAKYYRRMNPDGDYKEAQWNMEMSSDNFNNSNSGNPYSTTSMMSSKFRSTKIHPGNESPC